EGRILDAQHEVEPVLLELDQVRTSRRRVEYVLAVLRGALGRARYAAGAQLDRGIGGLGLREAEDGQTHSDPSRAHRVAESHRHRLVSHARPRAGTRVMEKTGQDRAAGGCGERAAAVTAANASRATLPRSFRWRRCRARSALNICLDAAWRASFGVCREAPSAPAASGPGEPAPRPLLRGERPTRGDDLALPLVRRCNDVEEVENVFAHI